MLARIAAGLLALVAAGCASVGPDASGGEIFSELCARCHGGDLQGGVGPALDAGSNAAEQPDEYLRTTILRGRGSMPSFSGTLSEEQVDRLVGFLREEQRG